MIRNKTVLVENAEYLIGPLTMGQIDAFTRDHEELDDLDKDKKLAELRSRAMQAVCDGLNNPHMREKDFRLWTPDLIRAELDYVTFNELETQILKLTKVKRVRNASGELEDPKLGESDAAAEPS
jgi:hypothetical protein